MMGSFITRGLIMALGYAYPAYECYKTVGKNKPEIEQLIFWCQYWILVAVLTIFERVGDTFISWMPMYCEAKLAFYIYLWYPKTRGTKYVYETFFEPYVAKHEIEIDRNLLELRARAGDAAVLYLQKAAVYGQARFFEILQYVASQSQPSRAQPAQPQQPLPQQEKQKKQARQQPPPIVPTRQPAVAPPQPPPLQKPIPQPPPSPAKSKIHDPPPEPATTSAMVAPPALSATPPSPLRVTTPSSTAAETATTPKDSKMVEAVEAEQAEQAITIKKKEDTDPTPKETVMEEAIRVTRGRLRRTRSTAASTR